MVAKRLLVVDDDPEFGAFVRRVAEGEGYEVNVTTGAEAFKQAYQTFDPTVLLLDVVMPDVEGVELVDWLAGQGCKAKIIILSGVDPRYPKWAKDLGEAKGLPSLTTFTKPIRLADLRKALA